MVGPAGVVGVGVNVGTICVGVGVLVGDVQDTHRVLSPPTICGQVQSVVRVIVPAIGVLQLLDNDWN